MKNQIKKDFTICPNALIDDESIISAARFLFVWLCSKSEDWKFHNSVIEKACGISSDTRIKYMKILAEKGWITVTQKKNNKGEWGENEIILNPYPIFSGTVKNTVQEKTGNRETHPHSNTDSETKNELFTKTELMPLPDQILNYLNEQLKKINPAARGFSAINRNLSDIKIWIKAGYKIEDFEKVIENRIREWAKSPKMNGYLRPQTIFGQNFESYLLMANSKVFEMSAAGSNNYKHEPTAEPVFKQP